jgi:hypothetical protein
MPNNTMSDEGFKGVRYNDFQCGGDFVEIEIDALQPAQLPEKEALQTSSRATSTSRTQDNPKAKREVIITHENEPDTTERHSADLGEIIKFALSLYDLKISQPSIFCPQMIASNQIWIWELVAEYWQLSSPPAQAGQSAPENDVAQFPLHYRLEDTFIGITERERWQLAGGFGLIHRLENGGRRARSILDPTKLQEMGRSPCMTGFYGLTSTVCGLRKVLDDLKNIESPIPPDKERYESLRGKLDKLYTFIGELKSSLEENLKRGKVSDEGTIYQLKECILLEMVGQMVVASSKDLCYRLRGLFCWAVTNANLSSVEVYVSAVEGGDIPFHGKFPMSQFGVGYHIEIDKDRKNVKSNIQIYELGKADFSVLIQNLANKISFFPSQLCLSPFGTDSTSIVALS